MKKFFIFTLCLLLLVFNFSACGNQVDTLQSGSNDIITQEPTLQEEDVTPEEPETTTQEEPPQQSDETPEQSDETSSETTESEQTEEPAEPVQQEDWEWQKDTPENQGVDSNALEAVHATFDTFPLLTSVIVRNGYIIDEYYKDGYDETSSFVLNSSSKSVTSAIIGIAIDKGYIDGVDVPISEYFPQILEYENAYWGQITIWKLLTHTSGISTTDDVLWTEWRSSDNWVDYILNLPIVSEPGTEFSYSTGNTHLLSAILEKATGMTLYDFGKQYLFDPVGMDSVQIELDPQGIADGGNGIWMTPYDMAKFGQLYLNHGVWEGQQIISSEWVEQSTSVQFVRSTGTANYGYQWWVRTFGDQNYAAYFAQGHAGQYIFVIPQLALVITFNSDYTGPTSIYWQLVNDIVAACEE